MSLLVEPDPSLAQDGDPNLVFRARFLALELLIDMLWTDRLAKLTNPVDHAINLRRDVLRAVTLRPHEVMDEDHRLLHDTSVALLDERLNNIVNRVAGLEPPQPSLRAASMGTARTHR